MHVPHSKVHRSGNPLNLTVFLISRIGWAQLGHRGGFVADLLARSGHMAKDSVGKDSVGKDSVQ